MSARKKDEQILLKHEDVPSDLFVLGTEVMCGDVGKFSSCEQLSHPISIHPTFDMGKFEVTLVVYRHLFLTSKRTGNNPIFLDPQCSITRKTSRLSKSYLGHVMLAVKVWKSAEGT